ncbi:GNAT family N-acetyltransferase [Anaerocolumna chitinilytica]|uniref:N-acetyltransferase domain-containing protein n=1 Tax=Anaerocolumna chitinilytica TaxID=1727145 RepID=A0A7I8DSF5_9FIRM|nr:GNAT family N-acetyltransferase [Anaerocolumna chitinilytica]BCK00658.1 hypothetical protein bsdcttw_36980 [Anaerocolumna chitinilytica]
MKDIIYKQVGQEALSIYDSVSMAVDVEEIYEIHKTGNGMEGVSYHFYRKKVPPYVIDFAEDDSAVDWTKRFDVSNWAFFIAFDGEKAIGGAAVASKTEGVMMLEGRDDITVLWDLRVERGYKQHGIGKRLFDMASAWSKNNGFKRMKIECQNTNLPACNFYQKQGAKLCVINENGYKNSDEAMLLWYLDL